MSIIDESDCELDTFIAAEFDECFIKSDRRLAGAPRAALPPLVDGEEALSRHSLRPDLVPGAGSEGGS
ncbi:hypothetical protein [Streptomyces sp. NPDC002054]|uniref:hypothetical protein n=1 Tax=Streptomyces sp. NPDC002054 TaxID=3154663 RepID=UPI0033192820